MTIRKYAQKTSKRFTLKALIIKHYVLVNQFIAISLGTKADSHFKLTTLSNQNPYNYKNHNSS